MAHHRTTLLATLLSVVAVPSSFALSATASTSQLNCTQASVTSYINLCLPVWASLGSSTTVSSSTITYATSSASSLAVCYNHNLCECISAMYTGYNMSLTQTCNMAVANGYFIGTQAKNVSSATSTPTTALGILEQAMMNSFLGSST